MKILLSGVDTNNKGAELMLYAILQEVERKFPKATVFIPHDKIKQGISYISTNLDFREIPYRKFETKYHLSALYWLFHIPYRLMPHIKAIGKIDYYIDGSGFRFSDQFDLTENHVRLLNLQLGAYREKGARIIYLPQAFGPFEKPNTKNVMKVINKHVSLLMPREKVSYQYIVESGLIDKSRVKMFTDFTSLVDGVFPKRFDYLRNGVCIIPNLQMINKGAISMDEYQAMLRTIMSLCVKSGRKVYLLNHEGIKDEKLCLDLKMELSDQIDVVTGLNALEVKGLIASSYLVISSRFHGVASALNSCVPCLATSWSHKYKELFNDYTMTDCILPLDNTEKSLGMIYEFLNEEKNQRVRNILLQRLPAIKNETRCMWESVWSC